MRKLLWTVSALGALAGGAVLVAGLMGSTGPGQTMMAAVSLALAVVPYCLARSVDAFKRTSDDYDRDR